MQWLMLMVLMMVEVVVVVVMGTEAAGVVGVATRKGAWPAGRHDLLGEEVEEVLLLRLLVMRVVSHPDLPQGVRAN